MQHTGFDMTDAGIDTHRLAALYPRLYHLSDSRNWPGIQRHGLLSTSALLDLFSLAMGARAAIENRRRAQAVELHDPVLGTAVIRDQGTLSDRALGRSLAAGMEPPTWYALLNRRVFFWVSQKRLRRLSAAAANRNSRQIVLSVSTAGLLARHCQRTELSAYNTGSARKPPQSLGHDTFLPLQQYRHRSWLAKRGRRDSIVELTVIDAVPDILDLLIETEVVEPFT